VLEVDEELDDTLVPVDMDDTLVKLLFVASVVSEMEDTVVADDKLLAVDMDVLSLVVDDDMLVKDVPVVGMLVVLDAVVCVLEVDVDVVDV